MNGMSAGTCFFLRHRRHAVIYPLHLNLFALSPADKVCSVQRVYKISLKKSFLLVPPQSLDGGGDDAAQRSPRHRTRWGRSRVADSDPHSYQSGIFDPAIPLTMLLLTDYRLVYIKKPERTWYLLAVGAITTRDFSVLPIWSHFIFLCIYSDRC